MSAKIPATVVTGFLGAGKTTLIRRLIEQSNGRRIALIVNEFGDIGVDGDLLRSCGFEDCGEDDIVELANGCLCCTVADDFVPTMRALIERDQPPEHIVIETSGLALPKPLVQAFNWPEVRTRVTVDGVVAVVDAPAVAAGLFAPDPQAIEAQRAADEQLDHETPLEELFEEQLNCADLVIVNKRDQLQAGQLESVHAEVARQLRPGVRAINVAHGEIDPGVLLGLDAGAEDDLDSRPSHHDGEDDHDHDDFESFHVSLGEVASPAELTARVSAAITAHNILRVKGFAAVAGKPMRLVLQAVGDRVQTHFDRAFDDGEPRTTRLVVIGERGLDRAGIEAAFGAIAHAA